MRKKREGEEQNTKRKVTSENCQTQTDEEGFREAAAKWHGSQSGEIKDNCMCA